MDQLVLKNQLDKIMADNLYPNAKSLLSLAKQQNSNITMKQIQEYLSNQKAYQLTKERKITKKKNISKKSNSSSDKSITNDSSESECESEIVKDKYACGKCLLSMKK